MVFLGLAVSVVPLHDFVVLLDLLFDVRQFALQVLAALLLLQERACDGGMKNPDL